MITPQEATELSKQNVEALLASIPSPIVNAITNAAKEGMFEVHLDLDPREHAALGFLGYHLYFRMNCDSPRYTVSWPTK